MKKLICMMMFCVGLARADFDYNYSTNLFSPTIGVTNIYFGTNSTDTNRDSFRVWANKINHNAMTLDTRTTTINSTLTNFIGTNYVGAMKPYTTNATLTSASSLKINFTAFPDLTTNYTVTAPNELMGVLTTNKASNNFTISFTTVTMTNHTLEGAVIHK